MPVARRLNAYSRRCKLYLLLIFVVLYLRLLTLSLVLGRNGGS